MTDGTANDRPNPPIWIFFCMTLLAWAIWIPQALQQHAVIDNAPSQQSPLNGLTVWAPGLAALVLTWIAAGKRGVTGLFRTLGRVRVPVRWYLAALLLESAKWGAALGIDRLLGRTYDLQPGILMSSFGAAAAYMVPVALVSALPNALGEELGWRAYALPRLQRKHGALVATLVIGLFWGAWHIPAWIAWGTVEIELLPLLWKTVSAVPAAIVFTWIFNNTRGSLLLVVLYHASITARWYLHSPLPTRTESILTWLIAILVLIFTNRRTFRRGNTQFPAAGEHLF